MRIFRTKRAKPSLATMKDKATSRVEINSDLLAITVGVFFLSITMKEELLLQKVLAIQLVSAIPLFLTSTLAYSKIEYSGHSSKWNKLGWSTFIIGYAFIMNVVGILISRLNGNVLSLMFFGISWLCILIYSIIEVSYNKDEIKDSLIKGLLFVSLQTFLGLFVVLGIY